MTRRIGLLAAATFLVLPVHAAQLVVFRDGRALRVATVALDAEIATLEFEGGGAMALPQSLIAELRPLPDLPVPVVPDGVDGAATPELVETLADTLRSGERWRSMAGDLADRVAEAADRYALDRALLAAMVKVESNFDPFAVSHKGACGLLQLIPATAARFGVRDVFDPEQNLDGGARYLRWLLDRFGGRTDLALAGYNAGEGAVSRHGGIPPYRETLSYVTRVLDGALRGAARE